MKVKFIGFWEFCPEDFDKVIERRAQAEAIREKFPDRFPKRIFGPYWMGETSKGFTVYETDNPDQLSNLTLHYIPVVRVKFIPIHEFVRQVELYQKMKK